jgi:hypothetical protein
MNVAKINPDRMIQLAVKLMRIDGQDRKAFNAAMRKEFPQITDYALHEARQSAKILLAIQYVTKRRENHDDT